MFFITTTGSVSLIPTTGLSRWIVAFVWGAYERLGIQMPPAHPGLCTHYPRILCQTRIYFRDVLVFQERMVGNIHPVHWTETLVLHFIGSNEWAEYT